LWAVVPVKPLSGAKQRLKNRLGPYREDFTLAMLGDVLSALADSQAVTGVAVVTADVRVASIATRHGFAVIEEGEAAGLNAAVDLGVQAARRLGAARVVILPADIPLLTGAELDRLVALLDREAGESREDAVGISPATGGGGTNCLLLSTRSAFAFQYGPDSFKLHRERAKADKRDVYSLASPTIALDIDEPRHLQQFLDFCSQHTEFQKTETWKFMSST